MRKLLHALPMQRKRPYGVLVPSFIAILAFGHSLYAQIAIPLIGKINTIAGTGTAGYSGDSGAATSAKLNQPTSVAVDASGNVYIADTTNSVVRKIMATTGMITTVAGTGTAGYSGDGGLATSAKLSGPKAVAVDSSANIYISRTLPTTEYAR